MLTSIERVSNMLKQKSIDRIPVHEHFWPETEKMYVESGKIKEGENFSDHFGLDIEEFAPFNVKIDIYKEIEILEETEDTITILDQNGATLRKTKKHTGTPEHIDFSVKTFDQWKEVREKLTVMDENRINFEGYRMAKAHAKDKNLFFVWSGLNVFECMHLVSGHENLLVGMALEPEWVKNMAMTYADLNIALMEILFAKEGKPDGIWLYEDLGFKGRPFFSPAMYKEIFFPAHKKIIDYVKSMNLPVIMHSCGYIEPLLPHIIEAGVDCYEAIEVKAGNDLLKLHKDYKDHLTFMGGIDVRAAITNDKKIIDQELESKIPFVKEGFGYCLHSDHSIPSEVEYETLKYFISRGIELGTY